MLSSQTRCWRGRSRFKFYDSDELETSEHVARISFTRVGYIEGGEDGLPGFKLNKNR